MSRDDLNTFETLSVWVDYHVVPRPCTGILGSTPWRCAPVSLLSGPDIPPNNSALNFFLSLETEELISAGLLVVGVRKEAPLCVAVKRAVVIGASLISLCENH